MTSLRHRTMPTFRRSTALAVVAVSFGLGVFAGEVIAAPGGCTRNRSNNMAQVFNSETMHADSTIPSSIVLEDETVFGILVVQLLDEPLRCLMFNDIFPQGLASLARPALGAEDPTFQSWILMTSSVTLVPDGSVPLVCPGDADGNKLVNFADVTSVLGNWTADCNAGN